MKFFLTSIITVLLLPIAISCGDGKKAKEAAIGEKKAELEKLKTDYNKIGEQIKKIEGEIATLDTTNTNSQKAKLVSVQTLQPTPFEHYIELQGRVDAENISFVTPRSMGGLVKNIYVKQGEYVSKGQLLMKLDDEVMRQSVIAAKAGLETIKTQLEYAKNIYQRQKNLWEQNIGTEVQLITAKNNVTSLENQLKATEENVKVTAAQLNTANVYSDVSGVVDAITIKVGETFSAASASMLGIKIVNTSSLKVVSNIPENYLNNISRGATVIVSVPDIHRIFNTTISFVGASIDAASRGFSVEARLPYDHLLKPNQIAIVKIRDYSNPNAISIPVNTLQNDERGKFVIVANKENDKLIARKRAVTIGMLNGDQLEIKNGLKFGDVLVTEGFQSLYDGLLITTQ